MILNLITAPASEPVTLENMESQVRLPGQLASEQEFVEGLITAVREQAEAVTRRSLITQVQELVLSAFPSGRNPITIPLPPLQNIVSIKYIDSNSVEQTLDPLSYRVMINTNDYGYILPVYGLSWPVALNDVAVVKVQFTCGYGDDYTFIPSGILQWMKINIGNLFENRETVIVEGSKAVLIDATATLADGLIANYRMLRL